MVQETKLEQLRLRTTTPPIGEQRTLAAVTATATASATPPAELPSVPREAYAIGEEVAQGGIGRVLRARDRRLDRPVAIKELLHRNTAQEQRFVREALLTARLQHPAIVPIYEAGRWPGGDPFYAMKLVSGRSLAERIGERAGFGERLALLPHVLTATHAVAYAHSRRIIHRDLKPHNVLVGEFGETLVIDWGLAKDLASDVADEPVAAPTRQARPTGEGLTLQGDVMGTPSYMPPEQAAGAAVDERADVYALGAVLYHVLAAVPPYHDAPWEQLLARIAAGPPRRIELLAPQLSDELAAIVHKAMARDPAARYRNAEELADDLERFQAGQIVAAHAYSARAAAPPLLAAPPGRPVDRRGRARCWSRRSSSRRSSRRIRPACSPSARSARRSRPASRRRGPPAAEVTRAQATARADEMTLLQAQDALRRDPNRALGWLLTLSPEFSDAARVRRIAADAHTRAAVARVPRAHRPHQPLRVSRPTARAS
jgi:serine/threonine protein kinase